MTLFLLIGFLIFFVLIFLFVYRWDWKNDLRGFRLVLNVLKLIIILIIGVWLYNTTRSQISYNSTNPEQYETAFNPIRKKIGLMPLPGNWERKTGPFNFQEGNGICGFSAPENEKLVKGYYEKVIFIRDNKIATEIDFYKSGNRKLRITYNFLDSTFVCYYSAADKEKQLSKQSALDTLKHW